MRYIYIITLVILASTTLGSAQFDHFDLSQSCMDEAQKLIGSEEINACVPISSFASLISNSKSENEEAAMKTMADSICGLPKCSDSLVASTQKDFRAACQQDLKAKNDLANSIDAAIALYSPLRDSICFKNSTDGYCFIESYTSLKQINDKAPKNQSPVLTFAGASNEQVCTPCNKAITNTFNNYQKVHPEAFTAIQGYSDKDVETAKNALTGKCGESFLDGQIGDTKQKPSEFQQQSSPNKSDASSLIANGLSLATFVGSLIALI
ncbi:18965_t:CDS:2 [Funneliformis geosporum]|uniref:732_t:CDS:1 n=1 Tax=Funneliformis geosporum TaxID=1117311 RepID=A0A9W4SSM4_9GLOM|nr:732_t:CDS:2 [Funneliformis geosporum]CAI2177773.1 18965_t:CDS:2 [Funneliformis geosporum]